MSKVLRPIEDNRRTLAAQVAERIRHAILNRDLMPGSRINQYQLAEDLSVSLVPVREALKTLEAEGLVTITPRRGAFVTEISLDDLDELYFARQLIEGESVRIASPKLNDDDFTFLRQTNDAMKGATDQRDIHAFMQLNRAFHMRIYQAMNNRHLVQVIEAMWERSELYRFRYLFVTRNAEPIHQEHEAILSALMNRDTDLAVQLARDHIWHTRIGIYEQISQDMAISALPAGGNTDGKKSD
ncbi:MAG: GntR family transcriptional regulator [Anaerolineae bacterium]|nr:GntR family transcriptional regulator [Anaerolineae bacterium]